VPGNEQRFDAQATRSPDSEPHGASQTSVAIAQTRDQSITTAIPIVRTSSRTGVVPDVPGIRAPPLSAERNDSDNVFTDGHVLDAYNVSQRSSISNLGDTASEWSSLQASLQSSTASVMFRMDLDASHSVALPTTGRGSPLATKSEPERATQSQESPLQNRQGLYRTATLDTSAQTPVQAQREELREELGRDNTPQASLRILRTGSPTPTQTPVVGRSSGLEPHGFRPTAVSLVVPGVAQDQSTPALIRTTPGGSFPSPATPIASIPSTQLNMSTPQSLQQDHASTPRGCLPSPATPDPASVAGTPQLPFAHTRPGGSFPTPATPMSTDAKSTQAVQLAMPSLARLESPLWAMYSAAAGAVLADPTDIASLFGVSAEALQGTHQVGNGFSVLNHQQQQPLKSHQEGLSHPEQQPSSDATHSWHSIRPPEIAITQAQRRDASHSQEALSKVQTPAFDLPASKVLQTHSIVTSSTAPGVPTPATELLRDPLADAAAQTSPSVLVVAASTSPSPLLDSSTTNSVSKGPHFPSKREGTLRVSPTVCSKTIRDKLEEAQTAITNLYDIIDRLRAQRERMDAARSARIKEQQARKLQGDPSASVDMVAGELDHTQSRPGNESGGSKGTPQPPVRIQHPVRGTLREVDGENELGDFITNSTRTSRRGSVSDSQLSRSTSPSLLASSSNGARLSASSGQAMLHPHMPASSPTRLVHVPNRRSPHPSGHPSPSHHTLDAPSPVATIHGVDAHGTPIRIEVSRAMARPNVAGAVRHPTPPWTTSS
jgi:hypothetical protein